MGECKMIYNIVSEQFKEQSGSDKVTKGKDKNKKNPITELNGQQSKL